MTPGYNLDMHESLWACLDSITSAIVEARRAQDEQTVQALAIAHKLVSRERSRFRALLSAGLLEKPRAQA